MLLYFLDTSVKRFKIDSIPNKGAEVIEEKWDADMILILYRIQHLSLHDDEDIIPEHSRESTVIGEKSEREEGTGSENHTNKSFEKFKPSYEDFEIATRNYSHSYKSEENLYYDALDYEPYEWEKYDDVDGKNIIECYDGI